MIYDKKPLSIDEQIELLKNRGLIIDDPVRAKNYLSNISYYRLSAYMLPFQKGNNGRHHDFNEGTTFNDVLNLYLFDREMRLIVFDVIERLEIAFRTQITYQCSHRYDAWWYENASHFKDDRSFSKNLSKIEDEISRSNETFIKHYNEKYTSPELPPAWMTFEVISMGLLSKVYRDLKTNDGKKAISQHFKLPNPYILQSWMHSLAYVRNICAHHGRLWNRTLTVKPELLKKPKYTWLTNNEINRNKLYAFLSCSLYLLKVINPKTNTGKYFRELFEKYPDTNLGAMGFPENWEDEELWR